MTRLSSAPVDPVFERPLVWQRQASIQHAYPNSFLQEVTQSQRRVASMLPWESKHLQGRVLRSLLIRARAACTRMIGDGTCTTL